MTVLSRACAALIAVAGMAPAFAAAERPGRAAAVVEACDWSRPGHNAYSGDVVGAVDRYPDLSPEVRQRLKERMARRAYDDVVTIRRDSISGKHRYGATIRDMHFGARRVCRNVDRSAWTPQMQERGLVYCESGDCILVPTVCRNVSRIRRAEVSDERIGAEPAPSLVASPPAGAAAAEKPELGAAPVPIVAGPADATSFEAGSLPGAGSGVPILIGGDGSGGGGGFIVTGPPPSGGGGTGVVAPPIVAPIPEPETWALLTIGLAGIGAAARRRESLRRRASAAPAPTRPAR